jgi:hypothetical protein
VSWFRFFLTLFVWCALSALVGAGVGLVVCGLLFG